MNHHANARRFTTSFLKNAATCEYTRLHTLTYLLCDVLLVLLTYHVLSHVGCTGNCTSVVVPRVVCCTVHPVLLTLVSAAEVVRWDEGGRCSESTMGMSKTASSTVRSLESLKSWGTLGTTSMRGGITRD